MAGSDSFVAALVLALSLGAANAQQPPAYRGCFNAEPPAGGTRETAPRVEAARVFVAPGAVGTVGILVLRGRDVTAADTTGTEPVALVTESVSAALWPNRDPIGNRMYDCIAARWVTIVGVVADVMKNRNQPIHYVFVPFRQL